jgi:hypothetical protein
MLNARWIGLLLWCGQLAIATIRLGAAPGHVHLKKLTNRALDSSAQTIDVDAARIALLALRADLARGAAVTGYVIAPAQRSVDMREAANSLAGMQKPVRCSGSLRGTLMIVQCTPWEGVRLPATWLNTLRQRCGEDLGVAKLLIRRVGDSTDVATVDGGAFLTWATDYVVTSSEAINNAAVAPPGVCGVFDFSAPPQGLHSPGATPRPAD